MAAELYKKMNGLEIARDHVRRVTERGSLDKIELAKAYEFGVSLGLRDMTRTFSKCEAILNAREFSKISTLVIQFEAMPTIMTVGGFSPEFDYDGRPLQRLGKADATYEQIGFSVLAAADRASVILTWLADAPVCLQFANSLISKDRKLLATLAIQTSFEHLENTCMKIGWWDSLLPVERQALMTRMQFAGSSFDERTGGSLQYCGITFDDWRYESHFFL